MERFKVCHWRANVGMLGMSNFGIKNIGSLTLGMSNLGAASGTLNSGTDDDNDATCLEGGCVGTLNVGGEETSVLGMPSFGIEKNGMSGTLMSRTGKTTASGTTLRSLGRMRWGTTGRRQQCPILALTLASLLALPIAAVVIARCRSQRQGRPEDVIATAKTLSPPPPLTDIAARPPPPLKTMTAIQCSLCSGRQHHRGHRYRCCRHHCICCSHCRRPCPLSCYHRCRCCRCRRHHRRCRRRRCHRHHTLTIASAVTIAAAFANVIAPPKLL